MFILAVVFTYLFAHYTYCTGTIPNGTLMSLDVWCHRPVAQMPPCLRSG